MHIYTFRQFQQRKQTFKVGYLAKQRWNFWHFGEKLKWVENWRRIFPSRVFSKLTKSIHKEKSRRFFSRFFAVHYKADFAANEQAYFATYFSCIKKYTICLDFLDINLMLKIIPKIIPKNNSKTLVKQGASCYTCFIRLLVTEGSLK